MSPALVTGGLGFVGRHLVQLLADKEGAVIAYNRDYSVSEDPRVQAVQGELFDIPRVCKVLCDYQVDRILHTAAMSHPELSIDLPVTTFAANVHGTLAILEAARMAGVRRIVNFSSECAYGHQERALVREDLRPQPTTPYGVTKVTTELLGDVYSARYGLDVISLRITEIYGPGNPMPGILKDMLSAAIHGRAFTLSTGAAHRFQFIHVDDVCRAAYAAATTRRARQRVYNITGGEQVTAAQLADLVRALLPQASISIGPGHIPTLDRQGPWDISAAQRDLAYQPEWTLDAGLRAYMEWLIDHPY